MNYQKYIEQLKPQLLDIQASGQCYLVHGALGHYKYHNN